MRRFALFITGMGLSALALAATASARDGTRARPGQATCSGPGNRSYPYGATLCGDSGFFERCRADGTIFGAWVRTKRRCVEEPDFRPKVDLN